MNCRTAIATLLIASAVPAPALEVEGNLIRLSDEEAAMCAEDACVIVGTERMKGFIHEMTSQAYEMGRQYERATCLTKL